MHEQNELLRFPEAPCYEIEDAFLIRGGDPPWRQEVEWIEPIGKYEDTDEGEVAEGEVEDHTGAEVEDQPHDVVVEGQASSSSTPSSSSSSSSSSSRAPDDSSSRAPDESSSRAPDDSSSKAPDDSSRAPDDSSSGAPDESSTPDDSSSGAPDDSSSGSDDTFARSRDKCSVLVLINAMDILRGIYSGPQELFANYYLRLYTCMFRELAESRSSSSGRGLGTKYAYNSRGCYRRKNAKNNGLKDLPCQEIEAAFFAHGGVQLVR